MQHMQAPVGMVGVVRLVRRKSRKNLFSVLRYPFSRMRADVEAGECQMGRPITGREKEKERERERRRHGDVGHGWLVSRDWFRFVKWSFQPWFDEEVSSFING